MTFGLGRTDRAIMRMIGAPGSKTLSINMNLATGINPQTHIQALAILLPIVTELGFGASYFF